MAITTVDGWFAAQRQRLRCYKTGAKTVGAGQMVDLTGIIGNPYTADVNVLAYWSDVSAQGALPIDDFAPGATGYIATARYRCTAPSAAYIRDRFAEANVDVAVSSAGGTVNTPVTVDGTQAAIVARLPGGTHVNNCMPHLRVSAAPTGGGTFMAYIMYTNQVGVSGRRSPTFVINSTALGCVYEIPLAPQETGVQSIEALVVTTTAAVTVAGKFAVGLSRPLCAFDIRAANATDAQGWDLTGGIQVYQNSSLWFLNQPDSAGTGLASFELTIVSG